MDELYDDDHVSEYDDEFEDSVDYDELDDDDDFDDDDDESEVDEMLDAMMADSDDDYDDEMSGEYPEIFGRRRRKRRKARALAKKRRESQKKIMTARNRSTFRAKLARRSVSQKQFKVAMTRVGRDTRRNAMGIKTVNKRVMKVGGRVDNVVRVNRVQNRSIGKIKQQMKTNSILEFVESYDGTSIDTFQLLKGAVAGGYIGTGKGALSNPLLIGGLGLLLRNPAILGGVLQPTTTN